MGPDWRRPPMPAQLQLRVAVLGGVAVVMFVVIFLRLWYLGVLSGDEYLAEAQNNQVRELTVQAPRGAILDRDGEKLVTNRTALELQIKANELPAQLERRRLMFHRLGQAVGMEPAAIRKSVRRQLKELPGSPVRLQRDVDYETVYFLRENASRFPGVSVERVFVRQYPQGDLAPHLLGNVGEVDQKQLDDPAFEALEPGDMVGQSGVESTYDALLRGVNGTTRLQVDAGGNPTGGRLTESEPSQGNDLVLSLDSEVQRAGQAAVGQFGLGGFVAMNVNNGELLGLGSSPSYDPAALAKPALSPAEAKLIFGDPDEPGSAISAPALNRADQAEYPTGSIFKPITALAALDSGHLGLNEIIVDDGEFDAGDGVKKQNAGGAVHGPVDLRDALRVSSDIFFYELGLRTNSDSGDGGAIQEWSRALGLGEPTGIDVGTESDGLVPDPRWRNELYARSQEPSPRKAKTWSPPTSTSTAAPIARGLRATTSTSPSVRETSRQTRCRWPSPTRRSPTAARWCARTSACASKTASAVRSRRSSPPSGAPSRSSRNGSGRSWRAARRGDRAGWHLLQRLRRLSGGGRRQDRDRRDELGLRSVLVRRSRSL